MVGYLMVESGANALLHKNEERGKFLAIARVPSFLGRES